MKRSCFAAASGNTEEGGTFWRTMCCWGGGEVGSGGVEVEGEVEGDVEEKDPCWWCRPPAEEDDTEGERKNSLYGSVTVE